ncbi:MAG: hypothetical protein V6Z82_05790 [Flavobacteriales bacterium]
MSNGILEIKAASPTADGMIWGLFLFLCGSCADFYHVLKPGRV